ncbi:aminoglycoside phosphotransferase family protein [Agromyces sp. NPDC058110]|uniref:aminoglycoside phosphotransferase family protein n=1 Tax=Agromyces sp. NPDC058110 TaxID=3346345 RepID=UPI0036DDEE5D
MADAPEADLHPDEELVRRLVAHQHPDLVGPVRRETNGWDNVVFRLGDDLAVRMPRRTQAVGLVLHEQQWLPTLARRLPIAVPAPIRVGVPAPEFGYDAPWSIVPWLSGASALAFEESSRDAAAEALAEFVAALAVPAPADAPANAFRGVPLARRDASVRARLAGGRLADPDGVERAWERALAASVWHRPPVWLHGDLHPANLLLHADGSLAAVIDFGDLTSGDPATDLATAWLTFGPRGRERFVRRVEELVAVDAATWERARGWALVVATAVVDATDAGTPLARAAVGVLEGITAELG